MISVRSRPTSEHAN